MEALKYIGIAVLIAVNLHVTSVLGWYYTEYRKPLFNVKPFNCRECCTFWLTLMGGFALSAALSWHWIAATIAALGMGLFNFYMVKSKIKIEA